MTERNAVKDGFIAVRPWFHSAVWLWLALPALPAAAGSTLLVPDRVTAEDKTDLVWTWQVGPDGFQPGDTLELPDPHFHGQTWVRWGVLSPFPETCTAEGPGALASIGLVWADATHAGSRMRDVRLAVERSTCDATARSCSHAPTQDSVTTVYVASETGLAEGDVLRLHIGGGSSGCAEVCEDEGLADCSACTDCGFEVPSRAFPKIPLDASFCRDGTCEALDTTTLEVSSHTTVGHVHVTGPSEVQVGADFALKVAMLDSVGNPVTTGNHSIELRLTGLDLVAEDETKVSLSPGSGGWHDFSLRAGSTGIYRIEAVVDGRVEATSNPIQAMVTLPENRIYWGDIHTHSGFTWIDDEGDIHDLNQEYARDVVGLDVACESEKAAGVLLDETITWNQLVDTCSRMTVDGSFVSLLGFEWMGSEAALALDSEDDGHHNVYYDSCEGDYGTHAPEVVTDLTSSTGLWAWLEAVEESMGVQAVTLPHATRFTGYDFDVDNRDLQPMAEIYSEWGDDTIWSADSPEGSLPDMLNSGLHVGLIAASDNHDGFMGNPMAHYYSTGGLGAYLAPDLTRRDIFQALQARRTYATTGYRPILRMSIDDGDAHIETGSEYMARAPILSWEYHGRASVRAYEVMAIDMVEDAAPRTLLREEPGTTDLSGSLALALDGSTPQAVWLHFIEAGPNQAWSSPIYLSFDCARHTEADAEDPLSLCAPPDTGHADTGKGDGGSSDTGKGDGGASDGGSSDTGKGDGGASDGGSSDTGPHDTGTTDGGTTDGGGTVPPPETGGRCSRGGASKSGLLLLPLLLLRRRRRRPTSRPASPGARQSRS